MSLHTQLQQRAAAGKPIRIGLIGAGKFGSMYLAAAAYNGGPGRVYNTIKKSGSRNFWELQYYLPEESRNHVKKFIATHYVMETGNTDKNVANSSFNYSSLSDNDSSLITAQLTDSEKEILK